MRTRRVLRAATATFAALVVLSACGGEDTSSSSAESSADAVPASDLTEANFATTMGEAVAEAGSAHVTMSGAVAGQQITAEGDQAIGDAARDTRMSLTMEAAGQSFEMRLVDQVLYIDLGPLSDGKFAAIDLADSSNPMVAQFGGLADQTDLRSQLEGLDEAVTKFEKAGPTETIDGVETQPYTITVDSKKLLAAQGQDPAADAQVPDTLDYTVYVGEDQLPRRMTTSLQGADLTIDFTRWGDPVSVEKPADDQITELDLSQLGAGAGAA